MTTAAAAKEYEANTGRDFSVLDALDAEYLADEEPDAGERAAAREAERLAVLNKLVREVVEEHADSPGERLRRQLALSYTWRPNPRRLELIDALLALARFHLTFSPSGLDLAQTIYKASVEAWRKTRRSYEDNELPGDLGAAASCLHRALLEVLAGGDGALSRPEREYLELAGATLAKWYGREPPRPDPPKSRRRDRRKCPAATSLTSRAGFSLTRGSSTICCSRRRGERRESEAAAREAFMGSLRVHGVSFALGAASPSCGRLEGGRGPTFPLDSRPNSSVYTPRRGFK